jgi:hypothetical protein
MLLIPHKLMKGNELIKIKNEDGKLWKKRL